MKQTNLLKTFLLLCALIVGSTCAWADYEEVYTFSITKPAKGAVTDYTKSGDMTIDGITWTVPGNWYATGALRLGGKSLDAVDRTIAAQGVITEAVSKITVNHSGVTSDNLILNSVTVTVASDEDFTTVIETKTVNPTYGKNTAGNFDFTPTESEWPANSYYKFDFNITNSISSNYAFVLNSIVFYKTVASKTASETVISTTGLTNTDLKNGTAAGSLSASVTSGGNPVAGATVTWESEDESVATITDAGVVTLVGVGTTNITATYAGDNTYYGSSDTYELTVTDTRQATVTTIDASGITNTDIYVSTSAGKLTASVTAGGSPVVGATVTWTSSNPAVATIDNEGNITLVKVGKTTITASYAGAGAYTASSTTYELTVTDSNAPLLYESVSLYTAESDSGTKITNDNKANYLDEPDNWDGNKFSNAYPGRNGCFKLGTSSASGKIVTNAISLTKSGKLTFKAKQYKANEDDLTVSVTGATASGDLSVTAGADFAEYTVYLNNPTADVVITFTSTDRIYLDEIKLVNIEKENVSVSAAGLATFASDYSLDFTSVDGIEAYIAKENGSKIELEKVNKVPAGTGVLLRSVSGAAKAADVPVATTVDDVTGNLFVRGTGAAVESGSGPYNYVLAKHGSDIGFYKANDIVVAANKAYLQTTVAAARIDIEFDGDVTAIETVKSEKANNEYFNIAGQRVANPTKGLYIVNGRKVVVK